MTELVLPAARPYSQNRLMLNGIPGCDGPALRVESPVSPSGERTTMIIGNPARFEGEFVLACPYAGCGNKLMSVEVAVGPLKRQVAFAGVTYPRFEDAPLTRSRGADLPVDTILRVKWDRLTFYGQDRLLGPVEIDLLNKPSYGRVHSLANPEFDSPATWIGGAARTQTETFFPALNENHLYFEIHLPRWRLRLRNPEPVVNGAIIDAIPPAGIEYGLKAPVRFKASNLLMPFGTTLDRCRMAMSLLADVDLEVVSFQKTGSGHACLKVRATNRSAADRVRMGVVADSTAHILASPTPQFFELDRRPRDVTLDLDITRAEPPGIIVVGFVLIEPVESPGSNRIILDYDEIRLGRLEQGVPILTPAGWERSHLANVAA